MLFGDEGKVLILKAVEVVATDQMVSYFIADHTNRSLNWGLASALGGLLLASVLLVYVIYDRLVGIDNMKLG